MFSHWEQCYLGGKKKITFPSLLTSFLGWVNSNIPILRKFHLTPHHVVERPRDQLLACILLVEVLTGVAKIGAYKGI